MNVSPNTISRILTFGDEVSIVVALIIGIRIWKNATIAWRFLIVSVLLDSLAELFGHFYSKQHPNDNVGFNVYIIFLLWVLIFAALFILKNRLASMVGGVLLVTGTAIWGYFMKSHGINVFANWAFVSFSVIISAVYFVIFVQLFSNSHIRIVQQPLFWLCLAVIIYYSANVPIFSMINYLNSQNSDLAIKLYLINVVLCIVYNVLISYSFFMYHKLEKGSLNSAP